MESLLVNVSKYASSHQTSPIENFITETFAWLLRHDQLVRKSVCELLQAKSVKNVCSFSLLTDSDDIETQVNFAGKYPDLLWTSPEDDFCAIFEHKVWSELHTKQLSNYKEYAHNHLKKPFVIVLVTAHTGQHRQSPDVALCWYEIAEKIESIEPELTDDKTAWLRTEFVNLLSSNGLINTTPLNPMAINYYNDVKNIDKQLFEIIRRSLDSNWPLCAQGNTPEFNKTPKHRYSRGRYDVWGRIGLEFSAINDENNEKGWVPGIFSGFVIDADDHQIPDLLEQGPIAALVMSLNKKAQSKLKRTKTYRGFVEAFNAHLPDGWLLSDRTIIGKKYNPWHPLIVYKPLSALIKNVTTIDKQTSRFVEQLSELQSLLLSTEEFKDLCQELQQLEVEHDY